MSDWSLARLLEDHQPQLMSLLRHEARMLLRFESVDDLAQGVHLRALREEGGFEYRSEGEFLAWLRTLARRHLADRHDYWSALKRGSGRVLRLTWGDGSQSDPAAAPMPVISQTGASTFASRRELLVLAAKVLAALPPRDRSLVRWMSEGLSLEEQSQQLGLTYDATQRAAHRALERFRKAFALAARKA